MFLEFVLPGERLGAIGTHVGLKAGVDRGVALRLLLRPEAPLADAALQGADGAGVAVGPLPVLDLW